MKRIFITGGAGFIGSAFIRKALQGGHSLLNYDKLTYAADAAALGSIQDHKDYQFIQADICDEKTLEATLQKFAPDMVVHFAAESHVDNSIHAPGEFIETNIVGTFQLLKVTSSLFGNGKNPNFKFIHVSTDEVYGDLSADEPKFTIHSRYKPSSPYAASKAASDHLVQAWHRTYGFPAMITHCSNNYGPWQNREKFIPTVILNAVRGKDIPLYGKGDNIRDWIHVDDHVDALLQIMNTGKLGDTYNIGGEHEMKNMDLAHLICDRLDVLQPSKTGKPHRSQIKLVTDRLGHDKRYAIDNGHIQKTLGWNPKISFKDGIDQTISWYVKQYGDAK
jgi:dTDP-glucose 4,6-dehydratase